MCNKDWRSECQGETGRLQLCSILEVGVLQMDIGDERRLISGHGNLEPMFLMMYYLETANNFIKVIGNNT